MVVTKMKKAKIKCRECDCWSLTCDIKKKIRRYKTIHTLTKRIKDRTTDNNNNNNNNSISSNNNNSNNNNSNNKSHYKQGEKKSKDIKVKQAKTFKQIIMTPQHYPPTFLPRFRVLNPPEKQLYK